MTDVYQDFLPKQHFSDLQRLFMTNMLPWHFSDRVVSTQRHFMFGHTFMEDGQVVNPTYFEPVRGMLMHLQQSPKTRTAILALPRFLLFSSSVGGVVLFGIFIPIHNKGYKIQGKVL